MTASYDYYELKYPHEGLKGGFIHLTVPLDGLVLAEVEWEVAHAAVAPVVEPTARHRGHAGEIGRALGILFLYLLVYRNEAEDWDSQGHRLGFEGLDFLQDFRPQWHHIFPRKYLEGLVDEAAVDALANIAVIGPEINIRISSKDPMSYIAKYGITPEKLGQQFIEHDVVTIGHRGYLDWLKGRAKVLAAEGNKFLKNLSAGTA